MARETTLPPRSIDADFLVAVTERCGDCQHLVEVTYTSIERCCWYLLPGTHGSIDLAELRAGRIRERARAAMVVLDKVHGIVCYRVLVTDRKLAVAAWHACRGTEADS